MGYFTQFEGTLKFNDNTTIAMIALVKTFLGEDCRDHQEWGHQDLTYIDLELNSDMTGLQWDGSEKTYDLVEKVNVILTNVRKEYQDFGLNDGLVAQGEEIGDRWELVIEGGIAVRKDFNHTSSREEVLEHFHDTTVGLWATDNPDAIPDDKKHLFFQIKSVI